MTENKEITKTLEVRRILHILFILTVFFVSVEDLATYLCLTMRKDIAEVGPSIFFISIFGLEIGLLIAFLIPSTTAFLCYYFALRLLPKREKNPVSRDIFFALFVALAGLCFGLFASAFNDATGLLFAYTPLGWLNPSSRYLILIIIVAIGAALAINAERRLPLG